LTIACSISKLPGEYKVNSLNAAVARQLEAAGVELHAGERIRYVVMDKRRAAWDPMAGYFYDPQPGSMPAAPELFDAEQTAKFDWLPVDRVYDAGTIVIYDVKGLRDGPSPQ
jgi:DNA polymerase elongation subunit (family B)